MREEWLEFALSLSLESPLFYEGGSKKIFRGRTLSMTNFNDPVSLEDAGYTPVKLTLLKKLYTHQESLDVAKDLWVDRSKSNRYGSVGFSCYGHTLKSHSGENANHISSKMGPCLQSVILTGHQKTSSVDVFYRTTEICKKFPADIVLLWDYLLKNFDFSLRPLQEIKFHFANITMSPTYYAVILFNFDDPVRELKRLALKEPKFHKYTCRYLWSYLHQDAPRSSFNQSRMAKKSTLSIASKEAVEEVLEYLETLPFYDQITKTKY